MDYKEKYEALVGGIKGWLDKYVGDWQRGVFNLPFDKTGEIAKDIIKLVPELAESEDERLEKARETLIKALKREIDEHCEGYAYFGITVKDIVAILEKQKEQQPVPALDRGDEIILKAICEELKDAPGWVERIEGWYSLAKDAQQPAERSDGDERIRKNICRIVKEHMRHCAEAGIETGDHREALQYLEKQKEQKPADWTDADEKILKRIIERLRFVIPVPGEGLVGVTFKHSEDAEAINWLKRRVTSQPQPKQEWSEEEVDAMVKVFSDNLPLCGEFQSYHDALVHTYRQGVLAALKAIRPQPQWKPSEEQMCSLKNAIDYYVSRTHDEIVEPYLNTLYDDLKKL